MKKCFVLYLLPLLLLCQGCAVVMASHLPVARPPEGLIAGLPQERIDAIYGAPIAAGMNESNSEYIEQIHFVDGVPYGWKFARIFIHVGLDLDTFFLWEIPGTIIEASNASYPEYTYYLVYNNDNCLVRVIPGDSEEGCRIAQLPWVNHSFDLWRDCDGVNVNPTPLRLAPEQR